MFGRDVHAQIVYGVPAANVLVPIVTCVCRVVAFSVSSSPVQLYCGCGAPLRVQLIFADVIWFVPKFFSVTVTGRVPAQKLSGESMEEIPASFGAVIHEYDTDPQNCLGQKPKDQLDGPVDPENPQHWVSNDMSVFW